MIRAMLAATVIAGVSALSPAAAQEVTLKASFAWPESHWLWAQGGADFSARVADKSGGRIAFESYPAGALGKETVGLMQAGVAQIGIIAPSYEAAKLPLSSLVELPGFHATACEGTRKFWKLAQEGGALFESEYRALGIRPLYVNVISPYSVFTATRPVDSLATLSGLKIRANGAAMDKTMRALGAVPVRVTHAEIHDSMTRGTVDGGLWPMASVRSEKLDHLFRHVVHGTRLGAGSTIFAIGESAWQALSDADRRILAEAAQETQDHMCAYLDAQTEETLAAFRETGATEVHELPAAEVALFEAALADVGAQWAQELDSTGRDGSGLLKLYRETTAD